MKAPMEKVKDKYLEEIAEIPEKVARTDQSFPEKTDVLMSNDPINPHVINEDEMLYDNNFSKHPLKDNSIKTGLLSADFKKKIKESVPPDFDITQIGKIDLKEAEKIANEEIVFLREEDLIEGLEDFELIPLKETLEEIPVNFESKKTVETKISSIPEPVKDDELSDITDELIFEDFSEAVTGDTQKTSDEEPVELISERIKIISEESSNTDNEPAKIVEGEINEKNQELDLGQEIIIEKEIFTEEHIDEKLSTEKITVSELILDESNIANQMSEVIIVDHESDNETLPEKYTDIYKKTNVSFIDDHYLAKSGDIIRKVDDSLTSRLAKMIDITKGNSYIIDVDNDLLKSRYTLEKQSISEYSDEASYEEKFITDTDFEFIDNSIIKEDFIHYILEIDDYYYDEVRSATSDISEIMGFAKDEDKFFEEKLFGEYFSDIDIDSEIEYINPYFDFFNRSTPEKKNLIYLIDDPHSLDGFEKNSIEEDISAENAIVFEENVKEIESMLGDTSFINNEDEELLIQNEIVEEEEVLEEPIVFEDITDKVIILDDLENVNQFMETMPEKRDELTKLLAYLDGLFEKLPEDTVRKFAESEYFELYVKVMKELGV